MIYSVTMDGHSLSPTPPADRSLRDAKSQKRISLDRTIRRIVPSLAKLTYNPFLKRLVDLFDVVPRLIFKELRDIPPNHLRIRVGVESRIFANHLRYLLEAETFWLYAFHSHLCGPDSVIVDIGCGCGRYAHHLRDYVFKKQKFSGKYIGIDIDREMLDWCREHFDRERFEFHESTHASKVYGAREESEASYYVLPVGDETVDLVFSTSLFTHCLENEVLNYCREAFRVLKPGCCMAMYCFFLDYPPPTLGGRHSFSFSIGNARVESISVPEAAVAYESKFLFELARKVGFTSTELVREEPEDWQPMLLCRK